jgi:hypothetical protein
MWIVTVAAEEATADTEAVVPAGTLAALVPAAEEYQARVPTAPADTLAVVAAKLALPAVPATRLPLCAPRLTLAWECFGESDESSEPEGIAQPMRRAPSAMQTNPERSRARISMVVPSLG